MRRSNGAGRWFGNLVHGLMAAGVCALISATGTVVTGDGNNLTPIPVDNPVFAVGSITFTQECAGGGGSDFKRSFSEAIGEMLITELGAKGVETVERAKLREIIAEQAKNDTALFDDDTAAHMGKLAGAGYMILGTLTQLDVKVQEVKLPFGKRAIVRRSVVTAVVDARVVDVETGKPVTSFSGKGSEDAIGVSGIEELTEGVRIGSSEWSNGAVGKAARKAAQELAGRVAGHPWPARGARVLDIVADDQFVINAGRSHGLAANTRLAVCRVKEIKGSDGKVVFSKRERLAELAVVEVQERGALVKVVGRADGPEPIGKGDEVLRIAP